MCTGGRLPRTFPSPTPRQFLPPFLHGVGTPPPFYHHHPLIYSIKRSTINVYKLIAVDHSVISTDTTYFSTTKSRINMGRAGSDPEFHVDFGRKST